ncbi:MAG: cyclic 2,3-diphosphoglycerate synthase [Chloroflexi bacterium]|nr:cyclic 2,3-diphosphoglycerate synthase [Chloroflexota bacterium]
MEQIRTLIMGAAGRDFHNFNVAFRNDERYHIVAFTANQIPNIADRNYPPALAGPLYPQGIPIYAEPELEHLVAAHHVQQVILAYSDLSKATVLDIASRVLATGADFRLMGPNATMLQAHIPVISVCAVRTGSGKSQTTRRVVDILKAAGKRVVVIRHPMPYGDLAAQASQRFAVMADLDLNQCTIEEREEYEPHLERGVIVYAGVDYGRILRLAEAEADIIVWDGGNNDMPFYHSDLLIVVADPHRPGHERSYYPGQVNLRMADAVVINKIDTAEPQSVTAVRESIVDINPQAVIIDAASPISVPAPEQIYNKRVLVIEDGPTLTHGEMKYGAGWVAAKRFGAAAIVDPRPYAVGSIAETFSKYNVGPILPAMGYSAQQVDELQKTIRNTPCDLILVATPIDLGRLIPLGKPSQRVTYELQEIGNPNLQDILKPFTSEQN